MLGGGGDNDGALAKRFSQIKPIMGRWCRRSSPERSSHQDAAARVWFCQLSAVCFRDLSPDMAEVECTLGPPGVKWLWLPKVNREGGMQTANWGVKEQLITD